MSKKVTQKMRVYHRYLGFFLTGIMTVYAVSGFIMIFRNTETFKVERDYQVVLEKGLGEEQLGRALRMRGFKVLETNGDILSFEGGTYNAATGEASYNKKELPYLLDKIERMHKATTDSPLFFMNIFFSFSLFFFVLSSFWMFAPGKDPFKKGMYFAAAGVILVLVMVFW